MKYAIIDTNQYNGITNNGVIFLAQKIYSGDYKDKYAVPKNNISKFPEIFKSLSYEIVDLELINLINNHFLQPEIAQYRLINVIDLYNGTININLFDSLSLSTLQINRPYINGTWTDEDVSSYIKQFRETT